MPAPDPQSPLRAGLDGFLGPPWDEPSRLGRAGAAARRALRRVLRPYLVRRRAFDEVIVEALEANEQRLALSRWQQLATELPDDVREVETDAGPLWVDARDRLITPDLERNGSWESDVKRFLVDRLRAGDVFVDVGANIGYFSVIAARIVGRHGTVVALEPDARSAALLRANLWRNGCSNAHVVPAAATDRTGYTNFLPNEVGRAGSNIETHPVPGSVPVPSVRLDDLLAGWRVAALKVDIEGREHLALAGCEGLVRASPGLTVVCEFWPDRTELGITPAEILDGYERLGFDLFVLHEDGTTAPVSAARLLELAQPPLTNIVLQRRPDGHSGGAGS